MDLFRFTYIALAATLPSCAKPASPSSAAREPTCTEAWTMNCEMLRALGYHELACDAAGAAEACEADPPWPSSAEVRGGAGGSG